MIITRNKKQNAVLKEVVNYLDNKKVENFDVDEVIPRDCVSITANLDDTVIYIPEELSFSRFKIDEFVRDVLPFSKTEVHLERDVLVMTVSRSFTINQFKRLLDKLISHEEFIMILDR